MPLIKTQTLGKECAWGLWQIDETEEELSFLSLDSCPEDIVNEQKRLEWISARALTSALIGNFGLEYAGLRKDEFGKPFLKGLPHQLSLTHSFPYVAVQVDRWNPVGIDLEQPKEKLRHIAHRVFSPDEVLDAGGDITKLCIYWCAKESLYKIYGKRSLLFAEHLYISPFTLSDHGILTGRIQASGDEQTVHLTYDVTPDFVLVCTQPKRVSS